MQASKDMDIQKKDISGNTDSGRKKSGTHKIWLRAAAFAMVVLLLLVAAGKICDPIRLGLQDSVSERERYLLHLLSEPEDMVDVAILGDSESYTVLSTYHLWKDAGIASYIGGQSGQWIGESYFSLKKILKRQSPKVLILETNEFFSRGDASVIRMRRNPRRSLHGRCFRSSNITVSGRWNPPIRNCRRRFSMGLNCVQRWRRIRVVATCIQPTIEHR